MHAPSWPGRNNVPHLAHLQVTLPGILASIVDTAAARNIPEAGRGKRCHRHAAGLVICKQPNGQQSGKKVTCTPRERRERLPESKHSAATTIWACVHQWCASLVCMQKNPQVWAAARLTWKASTASTANSSVATGLPVAALKLPLLRAQGGGARCARPGSPRARMHGAICCREMCER